MENTDPRLEYISDYVLTTFKLKPDKWSKLINNEEHKQMIMEFFEKMDHPQLIIALNNAGALIPTLDFLPASKNKSVYFLKRDKREAVGKDNYKTSLVYGDISAAPLEQLSALVDEVKCFMRLSCHTSMLGPHCKHSSCIAILNLATASSFKYFAMIRIHA